MAEHDLTPKIAQFVDVHLLLDGHLRFLREQTELYDPETIARMELDLANKTDSADLQIDAIRAYHGEDQVPPVLEEKKAERDFDNREGAVHGPAGDVVQLLSDYGNDIEAIRGILAAGPGDQPEKLENRENLLRGLPAYYDLAKSKFEAGYYGEAYTMLDNYIRCIGDRAAFATVRYSNALWGRLAAAILTPEQENFSAVKECVDAIDKHIMQAKRRDDRDSAAADNDPDPIRCMSDREKLQLRTWLLHWCLYAYLGPPEASEAGADKWDNILELIFMAADDKQQMGAMTAGNGPDRYRQALQNNAPWLLRYVTAMVILHKRPLSDRFRRKQDVIKEVIYLIEQEAYQYADPITQFLQCLYVRFDFDGAQEQLRACRTMLENDYFLHDHVETFMKEARQLIFEIYCRIHHKIDINMLADKLGMTPAEAEKWIVDLILDSKLVAKIDSRDNYVLMDTEKQSVYQQVLDRTERLASGTFRLSADVQKLYGLGGYPADVRGGAAAAQGGAAENGPVAEDRPVSKRASGLRDAAPAGGYGGGGRRTGYSTGY